MARVVYSAPALDHLEHAFEALRSLNPQVAGRAAHAIVSAVDALGSHPLLGPRIDGENRGLTISIGETGFIALYRFVVPRDEVRVLAIRRQRELGYVP